MAGGVAERRQHCRRTPTIAAEFKARRSLWRGAGYILLYNVAFAAWVLLSPASDAIVNTVTNLVMVLGPLLTLPWCLRGLRSNRQGDQRGRPAEMGQYGTAPNRRLALLLGLGILCYSLGQATWTYYEQVLGEFTPFPSWADVGYLGAYPLLLAGLLALPKQRLSLQSRTRVVLDGLMIMTAMVTFSWYFVLGPTLLQGEGTLLTKAVGLAYPMWDLVLFFCVFLLLGYGNDVALRRAVLILIAGLGLIVVADSYFAYQVLQGTYATGTLLDVLWPCGFMLIALGVRALRLDIGSSTDTIPQTVATPASAIPPVPHRPNLWQSALPYLLFPAVGLLVVSTQGVDGDPALIMGVRSGGVLLIGLVLLRQVFALLENQQLYGRLHATYQQLLISTEALAVTHAELAVNHEALAEANQRLETLAAIDPLTNLPNHRAMNTALDAEVERAHRSHQPCAVLFLDLDHFKALNDRHGHLAGDAALREFGSVVRGALRTVDTVGRWGGEEFVVLLPQTDAVMAVRVAERMRQAVAAHSFGIDGALRLTCSIGVAAYCATATRDALIASADHAMYTAKRLGRNQVRTASDPTVAALLVETGECDVVEAEVALTAPVAALTVVT